VEEWICAILTIGGATCLEPIGVILWDPKVRSKVLRIIPSFTLHMQMSKPIVPGLVRNCRRKLNGNLPPEEDWKEPTTHGVMSWSRMVRSWRIRGRGNSQSKILPRTGLNGLHPSDRFLQMGMDSTT